MNKLEILRAARAKISAPGTWIKGCFAEDAAGRMTNTYSPDACRFCILGALKNVANPLASQENFDCMNLAWQELSDFLPAEFRLDLVQFNDYLRTTHSRVLGVFDSAISRLETA